MEPMKPHSKEAWDIASQWRPLASDTRMLAAAIDEALAEQRKKTLEEAANYVSEHKVCRDNWRAIRPLRSGEPLSITQIEYAWQLRKLKEKTND